MERLDEIPGVNRRTIENVIAEIGRDMGQFPDEDHLSSWAGMSPGNEESAGKRIRQRTTKGNRWLRRALVEAAWAASHTKRSYLGAQSRRLAARRGKKRALIAVGHTLLVIFYHLLKKEVRYIDLGPDYFDKLKPEQFRRYLVKRLESLGYVVTLEPQGPRGLKARRSYGKSPEASGHLSLLPSFGGNGDSLGITAPPQLSFRSRRQRRKRRMR